MPFYNALIQIFPVFPGCSGILTIHDDTEWWTSALKAVVYHFYHICVPIAPVYLNQTLVLSLCLVSMCVSVCVCVYLAL